MTFIKLPMVALMKPTKIGIICMYTVLTWTFSYRCLFFVDFSQGAEGEDVVDSDFSIDENDEPISDNDDEEKKKRRKPGTNTKAYKV